MHFPTSNFQIYTCSMVTLWQKWQLPTSKSTHVQWWHSDKKSNFRTYFQLPTSNFQIYTCSMVTLWQKFQLQDLLPTSNFQLPNLHMFNGDTLTKNFQLQDRYSYFQLPTSNFQIYTCSMVTLWLFEKIPTSGPTSNFQLPTSKSTHVQWWHSDKNDNFQLQDIYLIPTSKSTHVQWWHSDKMTTSNFRTFTYFQLPNLHMFNGDTLTKMTTSNFRTFTYFQLPNLHMLNGDTLTLFLDIEITFGTLCETKSKIGLCRHVRHPWNSPVSYFGAFP